MTKYLIDKGHKDIALIMTSEADTILETERRRGYERALTDNNINVNPDIIKYGNTDHDSGYRVMSDLLEEGIKPDGSICDR